MMVKLPLRQKFHIDDWDKIDEHMRMMILYMAEGMTTDREYAERLGVPWYSLGEWNEFLLSVGRSATSDINIAKQTAVNYIAALCSGT